MIVMDNIFFMIGDVERQHISLIIDEIREVTVVILGLKARILVWVRIQQETQRVTLRCVQPWLGFQKDCRLAAGPWN